MEKYLVVSVETHFEFQNQSEPCVVKWFQTKFFSNFSIFRSQTDDGEKGCEGGGVAKDVGGKEVKW